eukprot:4177372-Prymnesium_polylepis.1
MPVSRCKVQRRPTLHAVLCRDVCTRADQQFCYRCVAIPCGEMQRRPFALGLGKIDVRFALHKNLCHVEVTL